jgi:hypothetical protein
MDLGYPYTEEEIAERAARFKQLSKQLLYCRSVPDVKYNYYSRSRENEKDKEKEDTPYAVEYISKRHTRKVNRLKQYLVKWENYDEATWQFEYVLIQDLGKEVFTRLLL